MKITLACVLLIHFIYHTAIYWDVDLTHHTNGKIRITELNVGSLNMLEPFYDVDSEDPG